MSASSDSPVGLTGRVTRHGAIRAGRTGEVMVQIRGGDEAFLARDADGGSIDADEEIVVVEYIGEIMSQVIGQAGPALDLARTALNGQKDGKRETPAAP